MRATVKKIKEIIRVCVCVRERKGEGERERAEWY